MSCGILLSASQSYFMPPIKDLTGKRFGRLVIIGKSDIKDKLSRVRWICKCDCGIFKIILGNDIKSGKHLSCGCYQYKMSAEKNTTHGMSNSPEFNAWSQIKQRCLNPNDENFNRYGGRGIGICDRWVNSFENFIFDMGKRPSLKHSIDRYPDNDGNYEPSNCRWATTVQQNKNRRGCVWIEYNGEKMILTDWAAKLKCSLQCLRAKIKNTNSFHEVYKYYFYKNIFTPQQPHI